jgi:hypothetical protein
MTKRDIKEMLRLMDTFLAAIENLRTEMNLGFSKIRCELSGIRDDNSGVKSDVVLIRD